jgi:phytanoyl-CoA hydroxylase
VPITSSQHVDFERDGFLLQRNVLDHAEVEELRRATEELCEDLVRNASGRKRRSSVYTFQVARGRDAYINWESADQNVVMGVEPVVHLHATFAAYGNHPAFVDPSRALLGIEDIALFTEKLNVKRAGVGGPFALHQDYPYWKNGVADEPARLLTAMVALDAATRENGALEVLPGSHRLGEVTGKRSDDSFERLEIDPQLFDTSAMMTVAMEAGDVLFFGPFLVHRSPPNRSSRDRRAILYTYQRAGLKTQRQNARGWIAAEKTN